MLQGGPQKGRLQPGQCSSADAALSGLQAGFIGKIIDKATWKDI